MNGYGVGAIFMLMISVYLRLWDISGKLDRIAKALENRK